MLQAKIPKQGKMTRDMGVTVSNTNKQRWDGVKIAVSNTGNIEVRCIKYKRFVMSFKLLYQIQVTVGGVEGGWRREAMRKTPTSDTSILLTSCCIKYKQLLVERVEGGWRRERRRRAILVVDKQNFDSEC